MRGIFTAAFGKWPSAEEVVDKIRLLDSAVDNPLPEGLLVRRCLKEVDFLAPGNSPFGLVNTTWKEHGYTSAAMGRNISFPNNSRVHIHFAIPEGARGLWIGQNSSFPHEREIVFARGLEMLYQRVKKVGSKWHFEAEAVV
jgi:hypothetical protein